MGVWCRQAINGAPGEPQLIEPIDQAEPDAALLERKAASAAAKGWVVVHVSATAFTATKLRWQAGDMCVRDFWIE
jgi:hypothetical protein